MSDLLAWWRADPSVRVAARQPVPFVVTRRGGVTIEGYRDDAHAARCVQAWWAAQEASGQTAVEVEENDTAGT